MPYPFIPSLKGFYIFHGNSSWISHEPARLMLIAALYVLDSANYTILMNLTGVTWGNISAHISKLEASWYVESVLFEAL
jgi:DNA-binding MarR family transcriptional regulator